MRRKTILLLCLAVALACGGPAVEETEMAPDEESAPPAAASKQSPEATVLAELNETCAENWCYGDFNYDFLELECGNETCELFFRAERGSEEFEDSLVFEYDQPLVDEDYLEAGNWERVNDAITGWEEALVGG